MRKLMFREGKYSVKEPRCEPGSLWFQSLCSSPRCFKFVPLGSACIVRQAIPVIWEQSLRKCAGLERYRGLSPALAMVKKTWFLEVEWIPQHRTRQVRMTPGLIKGFYRTIKVLSTGIILEIIGWRSFQPGIIRYAHGSFGFFGLPATLRKTS